MLPFKKKLFNLDIDSVITAINVTFSHSREEINVKCDKNKAIFKKTLYRFTVENYFPLRD